MAWRTRPALFADIRPLIAARIKSEKLRAVFIRDRLGLVLNGDGGPADVGGPTPRSMPRFCHSAPSAHPASRPPIPALQQPAAPSAIRDVYRFSQGIPVRGRVG